MNAIIEQLNHWGGIVVPYAAQLLWQSSLLIIILLTLDLSLRNRVRSGVRYALWMLLPIKLLLPPSLAVPTGVGYWVDRTQIEPPVEQPVEQPLLMAEPAQPLIQSDLQFVETGWEFATDVELVEPIVAKPLTVMPAPTLSRHGWMAMVWLSGTIFLFARMIRRWVWVNAVVRGSEQADPEVGTLAYGQIQIRVTETRMSPALCGLFRPVILLPKLLMERLSKEQIRTVILHEQIHLRRRDLWVNCLQTLLQIAFWWHPLLWLANARIRMVREEAVDETVASELPDDEETYPQTLIEVAKLTFNRPLMALGLIGILESKNALKQRVQRLVSLPLVKTTRITWWQWCVVLFAALVALPMAQGNFPPQAAVEENPNSEDTVKHPSNVGIQLTPRSYETDLLRDRGNPVVQAILDANPSLDPSVEDLVDRGLTLDTPSKPTVTYVTPTAQNSAEMDRDGDPRSGTFPASSQAPPANPQTVHTSKSGVVTKISVVNPTNIDLVSRSRKLSEWLDQWCTGILIYQQSMRGKSASARADTLIDEARAAVLDLGEEAVPYLLSQLRVDPTGQLENQLRQLRNTETGNAATRDYVDSIMLPSLRRSGAAQLLGDIGAPAQKALPVLVELWSQHSERNRTPYYLGIQKILYDLNPRPEIAYPKKFSHWSERLAFETNVVAAAIKYCPQLPDDLRSQLDPLLKAAKNSQSQLPGQERLFTRTISVNVNTLYQGLEGVFANSLSRREGQEPNGSSRTVVTNASTANSALREYFEAAGVELKAPKMLYFNDRTGLLMVRASLEDIEIIQRATEVLNYEPPQITFEASAVIMSANRWREFFKTERMRSESPVANVFVHEGNSDELSDKLKAIEGARIFSAQRTTTLAGYVTSATVPPETGSPTELRGGFDANLVFDVVENEPTLLTVSANGTVTATGTLQKNGELVPLSKGDGKALLSENENGSTKFVNAVGWVKQSMQSGKLAIGDGQYLIMSGRSLDQAKGSVAAIVVRAMRIDPAGNYLAHPDASHIDNRLKLNSSTTDR